jgi:hypothetical protein
MNCDETTWLANHLPSTLISVNLCLSLSEVDCFGFYGLRFSFSHLTYFVLPEIACTLWKRNVCAFWDYSVCMLLALHKFLEPNKLKCLTVFVILMLMMVLSVLINCEYWVLLWIMFHHILNLCYFINKKYKYYNWKYICCILSWTQHALLMSTAYILHIQTDYRRVQLLYV